MAKKTSATKNDDSGHVAVVYFHGMGSQRRYEETSRLIDAMDTYATNSRDLRNDDQGRLVGIRPKSEPHYQDSNGAVTYIDAGYLPAGSDNKTPREMTRFYEVYWAPIMAGSSSPRRVAIWIVSQVLRPFKTLFTPWRERQRLRRAALADLMERHDKWPANVIPDDFDRLLNIYTEFENLDRKRLYPTGKFEEFLLYVDAETANKPEQGERLRHLSELWLSWYRITEIRNAIALLTILLALVLAGGVLVWLTLHLLQTLTDLTVPLIGSLPFGDALKAWIDPKWTTAAGFVTTFLVTAGLGKFLTDYMGDVEAWATYEETDEKNIRRKRVIDKGVDVLAHVLANKKCKCVVVVSHSLGTTIAHDTVLSINRRNMATKPSDSIAGPIDMRKIRHFVTIASPIDKINYFFESFRSKYHRYTRVVETLRGDIGTDPFSRNRKPYVHWVNYFDEADLIAGGLHSPVSRERLTHRVDNVHISNLQFPNPGKAHSAYFENRRVISDVYEMIFQDRYNYANLSLLPDHGGYDYDSAARAPGEKRGRAFPVHLAAAAIPWLGLLALILFVFSLITVAQIVVWMSMGLLAGLAVYYFVTRKMGNRQPL